MLHLTQVPLGGMENFCYIISDSKSNVAALVDPSWDVPALLQEVQKLSCKVTHILLTHTHFDHIQGVREAVDATKAKVYVHELETEPIAERGIEEITPLKEGSTIVLGSETINVIHTPGHTPGSVCFLFDDKIITGDTLFIGGCGRVDLPGGDPELMYQSLQRIKGLDPKLTIYSGHNYGNAPFATIEHQIKHNPYLSADFKNF